LALEPEVSIDEVLESPDRRDHAAMPEMDALREAHALQEADLVDVRFDARRSALAMLFDLRVALQFRLANTAALVMRNVEQFQWTASEPLGFGRVAHYVMGSKPAIKGTLFTFELACLSGWHLNAAASSAEFFVGDVPGLPDAQPNFVEDEERVISEGMPAWGSEFEPAWATFLDPVSPRAG